MRIAMRTVEARGRELSLVLAFMAGDPVERDETIHIDTTIIYNISLSHNPFNHRRNA